MMLRTAAILLFAPTLVVLASGCASMSPGVPVPPLPAEVEAAQTARQHEALAVRFEQEAQRRLEEAKGHRALGTAYQRGPQYHWINVVGIDAGTPALVRHCEQLARNAEEAAHTYSAMAEEHHRLALDPSTGK